MIHIVCSWRPCAVCSNCQDATELGAVFIGSESHSYSVSESSGKSTRGGRWHCGITLQTPGREFVFMCEQEQERREWLEALKRVISQPMTPEDYASKIQILHLIQCSKCFPVFTRRRKHESMYSAAESSLFLTLSIFETDEANLTRGKWWSPGRNKDKVSFGDTSERSPHCQKML